MNYMNNANKLGFGLALIAAVVAACASPVTPVTPTAGQAEIAATETMLAQTNGTPISTEGLTTEIASTSTSEAMATEDMSATSMPAATTQSNPPLTSIQIVQDAALGAYLADAAGRPLYIYTNDTTSTSTCTGACAAEWLPVTVSAIPSALVGVQTALLGTTMRADGTVQLTYNGHPVYYNVNDLTAGSMSGQGADNAWFLITPAGTAAH